MAARIRALQSAKTKMFFRLRGSPQAAAQASIIDGLQMMGKHFPRARW
jgi:hypothetical protein